MSVDLTIRLDEDLLGALDQLAEETDRPRNRLAAEAIKTYIAVSAWQTEKIRAGIAAADAGDFATDAELARIVSRYSAPS